ncbi:hypothetical protein [Burkholderia ubonensis]|uniref:hypothetical protein n=1 Tax=Burkholderia ubonensis TaxID=101571 RepID=UPI0012F7B69E|nr:hypothetical protein [Burkholderia ubonensis]
MTEKDNEVTPDGAQSANAAITEIDASSICIEVRDGKLVNCIVNASAADCPELLRNLAEIGAEIIRKMRGA